jgi:hypothetical protein
MDRTRARAPSPDEFIAVRAASAAMKNDLGNLRLTNLLDAARRELGYALVRLCSGSCLSR